MMTHMHITHYTAYNAVEEDDKSNGKCNSVEEIEQRYKLITMFVFIYSKSTPNVIQYFIIAGGEKKL